ncbi:carboxypeptidase regulatory-like domain-containing protein [Rubinisphaera sp. JC750]|uniref:carboxypeptidase regulatory-like domain-containing protein n=1 Tax=Rubinisphaera sp. JC750 TaxID=2898658 RepID=UPI001F469948|nr:carboxypeptidase regulatory-like domain-containing protein [Rubinisphaera sp. JC750]
MRVYLGRIILGLLLLAGCSDDRVAVYPTSGTVTFGDGDPVRVGIIEFESVEHGTTATGRINEDGTFTLGTYSADDGAAAGSQRVIVIQVIINDGLVKHHKDHGRAVPPRYASYETSGLTAEVKAADENSIAVQLD